MGHGTDGGAGGLLVVHLIFMNGEAFDEDSSKLTAEKGLIIRSGWFYLLLKNWVQEGNIKRKWPSEIQQQYYLQDSILES